jgi:crossover junction endodeoxyribonuclease RuvC
MRILGIDPGTNLMGYAVIAIEDKQVRVIEIGTLSLRHLKDQPSKLQHIFQDTKAIIERHSPEVMAIETPFYAQNVQSMFKLGRAQGVAIAAAMYQGIPVTEYSPEKDQTIRDRQWQCLQRTGRRHARHHPEYHLQRRIL